MTLTQKIENQIRESFEDWINAKSYDEAQTIHERLTKLEDNLDNLKAELSKVEEQDLI